MLFSTGSASAGELTAVETQCAVTKAKATGKLFKCLTGSVVRELKKNLSAEEVNQLVERCEAKHTPRFERAEARAVGRGETCVSVDDAASVQESLLESCRVLLEPGGASPPPNPLCRHAPVTNAEPFSFIPTDRSCCHRPEDGVGLPDGAIVVSDQDSGLRYILPDHSSSRPFGTFPAENLLVNGVSRDKHGFIIVTDLGGGRVFEVNPEKEETCLLYASPAPIPVLNGGPKHRS